MYQQSPQSLQFSKEMLYAHNIKRAKHGVPPLVLSNRLTNLAREWAKTLSLEKNRLYHRPNNKYGENLYLRYSSKPKNIAIVKHAIDAWYGETKNYNFNTEPKTNSTSHFTQMVWRSTRQLGVAKEKSITGSYVIVACYNPAGNVHGKFRQNVFPPR